MVARSGPTGSICADKNEHQQSSLRHPLWHLLLAARHNRKECTVSDVSSVLRMTTRTWKRTNPHCPRTYHNCYCFRLESFKWDVLKTISDWDCSEYQYIFSQIKHCQAIKPEWSINLYLSKLWINYSVHQKPFQKLPQLSQMLPFYTILCACF